ncbi:MAG: PQQ-binding-like beta-propeller repeat protein [Planctomycetaceae bacterium]|nr:PQQ-binding-like beta-propeller repeat protein [Planctomycetaceae bacterium]
MVDGRVYAMGHLDGEEIVWCLNASDGQVLWTHRYKSQLLPNLHEGGPCSTPTVDGDFVYTIGKEGQFYCLHKTDGTIQWHVELQKELDVKVPEWGFSSSPLILNNQVLLEGGRIVSFNKRNGQKLWQSDRHAAGYGSVATFEYDGRILLASLDCDGLRVSSSETGEELAFAEWKSPYETNSTTPIIQGNQIFISTGYDVGCGLFEFDGKSLKRIYSNKNMRNHFNNSVLLDGWIYGIDGNSHNGRNATLNCIQFSTGELAWKQRGLGCGSLIAADGKLIVLSEKGALVLAEQSEKGFTELARSELLSGRCWTAPALANGYLFARNAGGTLKCVKLPGEQQSSD